MHKAVEQTELQELMGGNKKILLHFMTEWCTPCKLTKKMLQSELSASSSFAIFVEVNCDEAQDLVLKYRIQGVPTLVLLDKNLNTTQKLIGYFPDKIKNLFNNIKSLPKSE